MKRTQDDMQPRRAFIRSVMASIAGMVVCIMMLSSSSWAWFTQRVGSNGNLLRAGCFNIEITVADPEAKLQAIDIKDGREFYELRKGKNYTVTLRRTADSTVKNGFCRISVKNSDGVIKDIGCSKNLGDTEDGTIEFNLVEVLENATLILETAWGEPICGDIKDGDTISISASENE